MTVLPYPTSLLSATPVSDPTPAECLAGLRRLLDRCLVRGGSLHPMEVQKALECLDVVDRAFDEQHAEQLKGSNHD